MEITALSYTVGVKRTFLPGYTKYHVLKHDNETVGNTTRLNLHCIDGSIVGIPDIAQKQIILYSNFNTAVHTQRRIKASQAHRQPEAIEGMEEHAADGNGI